MSKHRDCHHENRCPQLPGTIARINLPPGTVINLLNLLEIDSPSGVCLIIRIPLLGGNVASNAMSIMQAVQAAGGTIQFTNE